LGDDGARLRGAAFRVHQITRRETMRCKSFLPIFLTLAVAFAQSEQPSTSHMAVPRAWSDSALADWATPLPVLGARPGFFSEAEFYRIPVRPQYRAYPVYHPDREPKGYWEWVQKQPPKPLLEPEKLRTQNDWLEAGRVVFQELYLAIGFSDLIPLVRSAPALKEARIEMLPDGTLPLRWVVTPDGIRLAGQACQGCHARYLPDGTRIDGAPGNAMLRIQNLLQGITDNRRERSDAELAQLRRLRYAPVGGALAKRRRTPGHQIDELERFR
jgi:hypothetical protein